MLLRKLSQTVWLINNKNLFFTVLQAVSPESRHQQAQCLMRTCLLVHRRIFAGSLQGRTEQGCCWVLLYKDTILILESSALMMESPPQSAISNSITLEIRLRYLALWDINIQCIKGSMPLYSIPTNKWRVNIKIRVWELVFSPAGKNPASHIRVPRFDPDSGSSWFWLFTLASANADQARQRGWLRKLGSCLPHGISALHFWLLASELKGCPGHLGSIYLLSLALTLALTLYSK